MLLGRKAMTNLDSIWKSRDITLPAKFHIAKAMVFSVVMYECESWTIKKAECWRTEAFNLWCWRRLLRISGTGRRSNQSILKEINPESVQLSSLAWSCPTHCDPMDHSLPGFPVHHQLLELVQTHVHGVSDVIQPAHPLHPLLLLPSIFPSIRVFINKSILHIRWPKYWSFSFSIGSSNEYSGLVSFRIDGLISLLSKGLSRVFSNTTVQKHQFFDWVIYFSGIELQELLVYFWD